MIVEKTSVFVTADSGGKSSGTFTREISGIQVTTFPSSNALSKTEEHGFRYPS